MMQPALAAACILVRDMPSRRICRYLSMRSMAWPLSTTMRWCSKSSGSDSSASSCMTGLGRMLSLSGVVMSGSVLLMVWRFCEQGYCLHAPDTGLRAGGVWCIGWMCVGCCFQRLSAP